MPISKAFHQRILTLVDDHSYEYTRDELRNLLKISSSSLTNALVYGIVPTPKTLVKLADFFEVSLDYLLGKCATNDFVPAIKPVTFQERFTELCKEKQETYYKVALESGITSSLITRWFQKGYLPSLENMEVLCEHFKVSPDYLLGRSDFKK